MTSSFFKFRHDTINKYRKEFKPYLLHNHGRIRYGNNWMDYERALMDFNIDWMALKYHSGYHKRMRRMHGKEPKRNENERWVEVCFETTPYGKLVASFLKP